MKQRGLIARYPKRYKATTKSGHDQAIAPNLLKGQFTVIRPNTEWTTDLTSIWTDPGWIDWAVLLDWYSGQVIRWAMAEHMKTSLCRQALQMAYWCRKPGPGVMHPSDRGSQYASPLYRQRLVMMGMQASMSGKGQCWDNAPTERFFRTLKDECLHYESLTSRKEARLSVVDDLAYYNRQRPHSVLSYTSPMQYEQCKLSRVA